MYPPSDYKCHLAKTAFFALSLTAASLFGTAIAGAAIPDGKSVSVTAFGATPDDSSDDTDAINLAINTLGDQGGGTVLFPRGVYLVNTTVFTRPIVTRSNIRLQGLRDANSQAILSVLKMPRPTTNKTLLVIGDPRYSDPATDQIINPDAVQENIEITDLGFDLDNGRGRRAIQLRNPANNIVIRNCEGFQSGIDKGETPDQVNRGDNHFINFGCYSSDTVNGRVPSNIVVENCKVRGNLQLTADGGNGIKHLVIRNNEVRGAWSHGIALTTVGRTALFEDILIEGNQVLEIGGDGLYLSIDGTNTRESHVTEGAPFSMRNVIIRNNLFSLGANSSPNASGVNFGTFPQFSDVLFENNTITGHHTPAPTSRNAIVIDAWDLDWAKYSKNAILSGGAILADGTLHLPDNSFCSGMQVQLRPRSSSDILPPGFDAFRRYRILKSGSNAIQLLDSDGKVVLPAGAASAGSSFEVVFAPASERLTIKDNVIDGLWDYGMIARGAIDLLVEGNKISGCVRMSGDYEGARFLANEFDRDFNSGIVPTSLLSLSKTPVSRTSPNCIFSGNSWTLDETSIGVIYLFKAAVTFATNDPLRTLRYEFTQNSVSFRQTAKPLYDWAVIDSTSTGMVTASYSGNLLDRSLHSTAAEFQHTPIPEKSPSAPIAETPPQSEPPSIPDNQPVQQNSSVVLANLSCRGQVAEGEGAMIVGFAIAGTGAKKLLVRASGPSLKKFGVPGTLSNPTFKIYSSATGDIVAQNDDWSATPLNTIAVQEAAKQVGAFAWSVGSKDAASIVLLPAGGYTVVVNGTGSESGVALAELYSLPDSDSGALLAGLSARLLAGGGAEKPIIGMTLSGTGSKSVLIRGCGPGLRQFSIQNFLADPRMTFYKASNPPEILGSNDDWSENDFLRDSISAASSSSGAFPFTPGSTDSAMLLDLSAGSYTAVIEGDQTEGRIALVEAYSVP
ncbi:glycosyl hydrolase family 28-related protein [Nibricoccus sp. IMCC34717]|uniref:glycosyl hydrolase family 28-related protein n=1 Tax=Nibricoccus sp. IMCC34717 TaxID=3034021 RepID=UPI00384AEEB8